MSVPDEDRKRSSTHEEKYGNVDKNRDVFTFLSDFSAAINLACEIVSAVIVLCNFDS